MKRELLWMAFGFVMGAMGAFSALAILGWHP